MTISTHDRERNSTKTDLVDSGAQPTNAQHSIRHAIIAGRKATSHGHADKEKTPKTNKLRNVTEIENPIGEKSDESESSIYRIGRVNRLIDRNKYLTTIVKSNGTEKEFRIDTGSPKSKMPEDKIMKETEIQKVKHRYKDVNKNEVKIRGKIPVDIEYENNKQKMRSLNTE